MKSYLLAILVFGLISIGGLSYSYAVTVDVIENKMVTLIGEGYDPDSEDLIFEWVQIEGETVDLSSYSIPEPQFMAPDVDNGEIKVLKFKLTVTDPFGATSSDTVEIIVNPVNHNPIVDAGPNQIAFESVNVLTLVGSAYDPDGDDLRYSWKQISGQETKLGNENGRYLTLLPPLLDYSQTEPLVFELTVTDSYGGSASDIASVTPLSDLLSNRLISIDAGPLQTVKEGELVTLDVTGTTSNGQPISYTWAQILGTSVVLNGFNSENPTFIAPELPDVNEMLLSFQVTGYSQGNGWANDLALVKVVPSNGAPIADAGEDQHVRKNIIVKLDGIGTDPDGDRLRYNWEQTSGLTVELFERSESSVYFLTPDIPSTEEFAFMLTVTDPYGNYDTDDTMVTMSTANSPPKANAGPDLRVAGESNVTVYGSGVDANGDELTYLWKQISGERVTFETDQPTFSFTAPSVAPGESKRMVFQLKVTDTENQSDFDQMNVIVVPENSAPIVDAGSDMTGDENSVINLQCSAHDPDGDFISFTWSTNSAAIISDATNPGTSITLPSVVVDGEIVMICTASDGRLSASDSMTIKVNNLLTLDIVADAGPDRIVNENVRIALDGSKSYDPENQPISFMWTQIAGESVSLSSATSDKPSFVSPTVANNQIKILEFELRVYDDNGRSAIDTVVITVDPINSPPEATASAIQP